jgi:hypothetical protein
VATNPQVSPVKEKIIRERTLTPEELAAERSGKMPDMWEVIDTLAQKPQRWIDEDWWLAIVREDPKPSTYGGQNTLEQCQGVIEVRPGVSVSLDDREKIELAIKQKYGGKAYRLMLKRGRQKISESKCINEAQPKYPEMNGQPYQNPLPNANGQSDANTIAAKAIDTVANQPQEAMNIALNALRASAEIIARSAQPAPTGQPAPSPNDELDRALRQAMIAKLLAPPPDPIETFLRLKQALGDGGNGAGLTSNPMMDRILNAAVEKILNPAPPVSGRTTLLDLGREFIPVLGTTVRETMHEYRLSVEANARIAELQRGVAPGPGPQSVQQLPPAAIAAAPAPQPGQNPQPEAAPAAAVPATALTFPQIEAHIAKIVANAEYPIDEAVDRVLSFLYDTDGRLVAALLNPPSIDARLKPGKEGLLQLFTYEPALNVCMRNVPRVSEFIDKFLIAAKEAEEIEARLRAAVPATAAPAATPPAATPA